jgi:hypothetical protein
MALIENWGKAAFLGAVTLALMARCGSVVNDPTGHDNVFDKTFMALFNEMSGTSAIVNGQSVVTKAVFGAMRVKCKETDFLVYAKNLIGNRYDFANEKSGKVQAYDIATILKDNPRGIQENAYTEDELKGFYIYLFTQVRSGSKYRSMRVPPEYRVEDLASLAYESARED